MIYMNNRPHIKDLSGLRVNNLVVKSFVGLDNDQKALWNCLCDCGNEVIFRSTFLTSGNALSCGCINKYKSVKHKPQERLYIIWRNIKHRCYNQGDPSFNRYGGRGIVMCDSWRDNYQSFKSWSINNGYSDELTIDRIDNNGIYSPDNCRWVNRYVQNNNSSHNRIISFDGKSMTLSSWASYLGMSVSGLHKRLKKWPIEKALRSSNTKEVISN